MYKKFTHFSIKPSQILSWLRELYKQLECIFIIIKTSNTNYQEDFKSKELDRNMSWINLWVDKETKLCSDNKNRNGTINYIFVSYAGNNNWIPI